MCRRVNLGEEMITLAVDETASTEGRLAELCVNWLDRVDIEEGDKVRPYAYDWSIALYARKSLCPVVGRGRTLCKS